ncbi:MAG: hypothetical protein ACREOI_07680 [bacterium]
MGIGLFLYSKNSPKTKNIEKIIFPLGFKPVDEPSGRWYWWFKTDNYESIRGCHLDVMRVNDNQDYPKGTKTVFSSHTSACRSYEDLEIQNRVLRELRNSFGGSIYDPQEDRYGYIKNDIPKLSPAEKRCGLVYSHFEDNLGRAMIATSDLDRRYIELRNLGNKDVELTYDKNMITNNFIVVFLVSVFESFLKDLFIAYLEMDREIQNRIFEKKSKIEYITLKELLENKKTLAEIEADSYTFQNLHSANLAYSNYCGINLFQIWNKKKKIGKRFFNILKLLEKLLH